MKFVGLNAKGGQFFIIGAVFLTFLLFSVVLTVNEVLASDGDLSFREYANTVDREVNHVLDYQVYSDFDDMNNISDFVDVLEMDFRDRESEGNFMVIYGNSSKVIVKNIGLDGVSVNDDKVLNGAGGSTESKIRVAGVGNVAAPIYSDYDTELILTGEGPGDTVDFVEIGFNDNTYRFPVTKTNQVIFIIQKDVEEETYVYVK